jgi:acetyltransferase-like isoleucine patch superfamily enzyme
MHAPPGIADFDSAPNPSCSSFEKTEKQKMLAGELDWAEPVRIGENVWIGGGAYFKSGRKCSRNGRK